MFRGCALTLLFSFYDFESGLNLDFMAKRGGKIVAPHFARLTTDSSNGSSDEHRNVRCESWHAAALILCVCATNRHIVAKRCVLAVSRFGIRAPMIWKCPFLC